MIQPDYHSMPKLVAAMAGVPASGLYSCAPGSGIGGGGALRGGMLLWKYIANCVPSLIEDFGAKLSEYHRGYRAFSREFIERWGMAAPFGYDSR